MTTTTTVDELSEWLVGRIEFYGRVPAGSFTVDTELTELGLDSIYAMSLCADIEDTYGVPLDPSVFEHWTTLRELAEGVVGRMRTV